jgi:hypothetical protein
MRPASSRLRNALFGAAVLTSMAAACWVGYRWGYSAGLSDQGPEHRFLVVVRQAQGNSKSSSSTYTHFNIRDPRDAARLAEEEKRLKSIGADYYVAKGRVEATIRPEPDPRRVNSHQ